MGNFAYKRFEKLTPLLKALWTIIITTVVFEVAQMDLPTTVEEWKARGPQLGITLALAAIRALQNTWKNRELPGNPLYNLGKYWMLALLIPALTLGGCATLGVAGVASTAKQTTRETTFDEQGNANTFEHITESKGEVDKALFDFNYKGKADGSWDLAIGQDSEGVTSPQMQAAIAANVAMYQALFTALPSLVAAFSPVPIAGEAETPAPVTLPANVDVNQLLQILQGLGK